MGGSVDRSWLHADGLTEGEVGLCSKTAFVLDEIEEDRNERLNLRYGHGVGRLYRLEEDGTAVRRCKKVSWL